MCYSFFTFTPPPSSTSTNCDPLSAFTVSVLVFSPAGSSNATSVGRHCRWVRTCRGDSVND